MSRALPCVLSVVRAPLFLRSGHPLACARATFGMCAIAGVVGRAGFTNASLRTPRRTLWANANSLPSGALLTQRASVFSNAKKSFAPGTEEELKIREEAAFKESQDFLKRPVNEDGRNAPRARDVEYRLPSKKQLNGELPSAEELERALKEGKMDMFTTQPEKDED